MDDWSQFPLRQDLLTQESVDKSSSWLDKEQMLDNCSYLYLVTLAKIILDIDKGCFLDKGWNQTLILTFQGSFDTKC